MIHLFVPTLTEFWAPFNVLRYITFRTSYAAVTALLFSLLLGPSIIRRLKMIGTVEGTGREELHATHASKKGTPTMGGILILGAVTLSTLVWGNLLNRFVWVVLTVMLGLGAIGFLDDYLKWTKRNAKGLPARGKLMGQLAIALSLGVYLYQCPIDVARLYLDEPLGAVPGASLAIPFLKRILLPIGLLYVPFIILVLVGSSNAVNLTDGLDGLATGTLLSASVAYGGITYLAGHANFSTYLHLPFIRDAGELTVFLGALVGALLGFLWHNAYPAEVFMGDTGSLALGGAIGTTAILVKQEILLIVVGGIFVAEALSVILQVASFRLFNRRIFRMAPIHHHFQLMGWSEPKVIVRFWIVSWILALVSLSTLKLR